MTDYTQELQRIAALLRATTTDTPVARYTDEETDLRIFRLSRYEDSTNKTQVSIFYDHSPESYKSSEYVADGIDGVQNLSKIAGFDEFITVGGIKKGLVRKSILPVVTCHPGEYSEVHTSESVYLTQDLYEAAKMIAVNSVIATMADLENRLKENKIQAKLVLFLTENIFINETVFEELKANGYTIRDYEPHYVIDKEIKPENNERRGEIRRFFGGMR